MKKIILGILICFSTTAYGQELECKKFKNGKFKIIDSEVGNSIILRRGSKQIEYGEDSKLRLKFKVIWLNDCTYTLELTKVLENPQNFELPKGLILTVEILETKKDSYIQRTSSNLFDMVLEKEMFEIK